MSDSAAPPAVSERAVTVGGARNVRDLGGLVGRDGRLVRRGLLLRSDSLCRLDESGLQTLAAYGLRLVIDLRDASEVRYNGADLLPPGVRSVQYEVLGMKGLLGGTGREAFDRLSADGGSVAAMRSVYRRLAVRPEARAAWAEILRTLADEDTGPALFHCTAGKDRTGILAAIVLRVLGVADEDIVEDYLRSNEAFGDGWPEGFETMLSRVPDPERLRPLVRVERSYLQAAVEAMTEAYGDFAGYLDEGLGLDDETLERLRDRLLA